MTPKDSDLPSFLKALASLSHKYGYGISGSPEIFVMEHDDRDRIYRTDPHSRLEFA